MATTPRKKPVKFKRTRCACGSEDLREQDTILVCGACQRRYVGRAFVFRLRPNRAQQARLAQFAGAARFAWNWCLRQCETEYEDGLVAAGVLTRPESAPQTKAERKAWKKQVAQARKAAKQAEIKVETPSMNRARLYKLFAHQRDTDPSLSWIVDEKIHSHVYSYPIERVVKAYQTWWKMMGKGQKWGAPRFKPKGRNDSFTIQISAKHLQVKGITIPGIGAVRCFRSPLGRIQSGQPCSVTIRRIADHWEASISVRDFELAAPVREPLESVTGVDLGVNALVTHTHGDEIKRIAPPRLLEKALKRLRRLQRSVSRKEKGSKRVAKRRLEVAKLHAKVARMRKDYLDKLSHALVHSYNQIVIEGFDIRQLVSKSVGRRKRRREIMDAAWGELRRQLGYKSAWHGADLLVTAPLDPTDQTCHRCGERNKMAPTTNRYRCGSCGLTTTRQENTSRLLESFGRGSTPDPSFGPAPKVPRANGGTHARRRKTGSSSRERTAVGLDGSAAASAGATSQVETRTDGRT